jgi:RHH-type rel operon transcriptional repressor/antitoxin RelB
MLAIRLPADIEHRLEALAEATGRTKTFYAREAIVEHMDDLEDIYLAERRLHPRGSGAGPWFGELNLKLLPPKTSQNSTSP